MSDMMTLEYDPTDEYEHDMLASEWEDTDDLCECGGHFKKLPVANGPDDFKYQYECMSCGSTYES